MRALAVALIAALLFILTSPFIAQIRAWLKTTFGDAFALLVGGAVALSLAAVVATTVWRVRRTPREAAVVALAGALLVGYAMFFRTGVPDVDAVELFHFIEYGIITALFYRAVVHVGDLSVLWLVLLWGVLVGTGEEWVQWLTPVRTGEARDVALNLYAVVCGLAFSLGAWPPPALARRLQPGSWGRVTRFAAVVLVAFAAFVHVAHLGYEIRDDEAGRFRSQFTRDELVAVARDRALRWPAEPPELRALSKEDVYLTEGGTRVQRRNEAYARGDFRTAWLENRILEKYWDPLLDVRSFAGARQKHRWPPEQREEVRLKGATNDRDYESEAGLERVVLVTKTSFWIWTVVAVAATLAIGEWQERRR